MKINMKFFAQPLPLCTLAEDFLFIHHLRDALIHQQRP